MSVLREDRSTTTLTDAAAYERHRGASDWSDDRPSAADVAEDAALDRWAAERRAERDAAARARGEYVPSAEMRILASGLTLRLAQLAVFDVTITPTREGVLWAAVPDAAELDDLVAKLGDGSQHRMEFAAAEGGIWIRVLTNAHGEAFMVGGVAQDGPPF